MEDMERYGDYNDTDDDSAAGKPNVIGIILKILVGVVCFLVIGILAFRIFIFNSYPAEVTGLQYTDALRDHLDEHGELRAFTQVATIKYDDPKEGNFFFDDMILVPDADHIQVAVRYNRSLLQSIKEKYGIVFPEDADPSEMFTFTLVRTKSDYKPPEDGSAAPLPTESVGTVTVLSDSTSFMYEYIRLGFDGVDFGLDEGETPVGWYRLDITVNGAKMKAPYSLPVYQYSLPLEVHSVVGEEVRK